MSSMKASFAAVAATALLAGAPAVAEQTVEPMSVALTCNGQLFGGDYIVDPYPTAAPLTAEDFNSAAGEEIVGSASVLAGEYLIVTPVDPIGTDCNEFMDDLKDTGLIESINPNYIVGIGPGQ